MAKMIKCSDCGKEISAAAKSCPGCGSPQKAGANTPGKTVGRIIALFGLIPSVVGAFVYARDGNVAYAMLSGLGIIAFGGLFLICLRK